MTKLSTLGVAVTNSHLTRLDELCAISGMNRSAVVRRLIDAAEIVPAQFNATIQPPTQQKRSRRREKVLA